MYLYSVASSGRTSKASQVNHLVCWYVPTYSNILEHVPTVHQSALDLQALRGRTNRIAGEMELTRVNHIITPIQHTITERFVSTCFVNLSSIWRVTSSTVQKCYMMFKLLFEQIVSEHKNVQGLSQQCQPVDHHSSSPGIETEGQNSQDPNEPMTQ